MWTTKFINSVQLIVCRNGGAQSLRQFSKVLVNDNCKSHKMINFEKPKQLVFVRGLKKQSNLDVNAPRVDELGLEDSEYAVEPVQIEIQSTKPVKNVRKSRTRDGGQRQKRFDDEGETSNEHQEAQQKNAVDHNSEQKSQPRPPRKKKPFVDGDKLPAEPKSYKQVFADKSLLIHDSELNLSYYKLRYNNPELHAFMLMTKSKQYRAKKHLLMIEGRRLLLDALDAGLSLEYVLFSRHDQLKLICDKLKATESKPKIIRVPHHDLSFWSVSTTCPGIIGMFLKPADMEPIYTNVARAPTFSTIDKQNDPNDDEDNEEVDKSIAPTITVIIDQIRDPSNLGSVIRTCAAIPCQQVLLTKGCTDPWDTKALRGGAGGQFRIPIRGPMEWNSMESFLPSAEDFSLFIADNNWKPKTRKSLEETLESEQNDDSAIKEVFELPRTVPYTSVVFKGCKHVVLVIGGETEGISSEAYELLNQQRRLWKQSGDTTSPGHHAIQIPLANGVESLNTNAAASILLFEIRRQLSMK